MTQRTKLSLNLALRDRCLTVASSESATQLAARLDLQHGGLVVSSTQPSKVVHSARVGFPRMVIAIDPRAAEEVPATIDMPVDLLEADDGLIPPPSLAQLIDGQRDMGADFGVIPGRFIKSEDSHSLRALMTKANGLDRNDVIVRVPVAYTWLRPTNVSQLIAILATSRHPVALSLGDRADPLDNPGVPEGLRTVIAALPNLTVWKTDLAGIDALACGALATAVGVSTSLRHTCPPGRPGKAINKNDKSPRVFLPKLLRYVRASHLHDEWFASVPAWTCDCVICGGEPVDRFTGANDDFILASLHNTVAITALHRELIALPGAHRKVLWHQRLEEAQAAHVELSVYIQRKVQFPGVLQYWLDHT